MGPVTGATAEAAPETGGLRATRLMPYKKCGDKRTPVDLAELPEPMRRAWRPGLEPRREG